MADTIRGLTDEQLTDYEQRAEQAMLTAPLSDLDRIAAHRGATRTAAAHVAAGPDSASPDDLAGITPLWSAAVQDDLLPVVAEVYQDAAGTVHTQLIDAADLPSIPPVTSLASEAYLAQATNTFEAVGADLWETARSELLDGMAAGESIPELRDRLRASAGMTGRTATLVARTQVLDASNAGSYDTARVSGLDLLKGWEATPDARTRDTHSAAGAFYQGDGMVALNGKFVVGGFQCDRPHDPSLPASERYNCRCTLIYAMAPAVPMPPKDRSAEIEAWHAQRLAQVRAQHEQRLAEATARHARKLAELDATEAAETVVQAAQARHAARLAKLAAGYETRRAALAEERTRRLGEHIAQRPALPSAVVPEPVGIPSGAGPTPVPVRASLLRARTLTGIQAVFVRERRAALAGYSGTSRPHIWPGMARFEGDLETAREHAEGLLRGVERFPLVPIQVEPTSAPGTFYARLTGGRTVEIAERWSGNRAGYLSSIHRATMPDAGGIRWHPIGTGSPQAIALHEFGHALTDFISRRPTGRPSVWTRVRETIRVYAAERGLPEDKLIEREISLYAASNTDELVGEAFADAMVNGEGASVLSRRIMAVLVDEYDRTVGRAPGVGPAGLGRVLPTAPRPVSPIEAGLARSVAQALQALTQGRTIAEVRTLLEALPEAKDALKVARRATTTQGLTRSLNALATRRGLTLPSAKELKAIAAAERAALVAERKAARAAAAEAARIARAEKARQAAVKRQVKAVEQGEFQHLTLVEKHAGGASYTDPAGGRWIVETFTSETDARERALYAALQDLVTRDAADPPLRFAIGRGAPELRGGWQVAYPDLAAPVAGVGPTDWLEVPLARLQAVTPAKIKALVTKAGMGPDVAEKLIAQRTKTLVSKKARIVQPGPKPPKLEDVASAQMHIGGAVTGTDPKLRADVMAATERHAHFVPLTMQHLIGIGIDDQYGGSAFGSYAAVTEISGMRGGKTFDAFHVFLNKKWNLAARDHDAFLAEFAKLRRKRYFAASNLDPLNYTVSHELGHHVMRMFEFETSELGKKRGVYAPTLLRPLLKVIDEQLGMDFLARLDGAGIYRVAGGRQAIAQGYLDGVLARHAKMVEKLISKYAATGGFHEFMAEIWQMYTSLGAAAPAEIRTIGATMQALAEKYAKRFKP